MIITLLGHQWKSFWRGRNTGKNIVVHISLGILFLYFFSLALFCGLFLNEIIAEYFPAQETIKVFCSFLLYYFAIDILIRFMLQELPTLAVHNYLPLNISKRTIVSFLNITSLVSIFNLVPIVVFIPFIIKTIVPKLGLEVAISFIVSIVSISFFNHFFIMYIKRKTIVNSYWLIGFFILIVLLAGGDWLGVFSLRHISTSVFSIVLQKPFLVILFVVAAIGAYVNNIIYLRKNLYLDEGTKNEKEKTSADYNWLHKFGNIGDLISLDIKLILRNKRPRNLLIMAVLFILYGFIYFKPAQINKNNFGGLLFGSIVVTGMFIASYGQYLFAWHSSSFDGLMVSNANIKNYIKSKFILMQVYSTAAFLIALGYCFISWKLLPILAAGYCFNLGIHPVLVGIFATRNYKALDLNSTFNNRGGSAAQFLYTFVFVFIGFLLYFPSAYFINSWAGIACMGLVSFASFLCRDKWIDLITGEFNKNKYKILEGFREK